ncbi:hypothetical protein [Moorella sulfitireducens (nom. illeg.)]|uniref:hypothetical protein n=1 Tax=Neomoorella sulfitireducens TaxID=2972948 RepID=UPI0021ACF7C5|nr:hypothetical protein [Moorella sulfitireducens]
MRFRGPLNRMRQAENGFDCGRAVSRRLPVFFRACSSLTATPARRAASGRSLPGRQASAG